MLQIALNFELTSHKNCNLSTLLYPMLLLCRLVEMTSVVFELLWRILSNNSRDWLVLKGVKEWLFKLQNGSLFHPIFFKFFFWNEYVANSQYVQFLQILYISEGCCYTNCVIQITVYLHEYKHFAFIQVNF